VERGATNAFVLCEVTLMPYFLPTEHIHRVRIDGLDDLCGPVHRFRLKDD
jgi:hypothetical protein